MRTHVKPSERTECLKSGVVLGSKNLNGAILGYAIILLTTYELLGL